jgi:hypothetical protein
MLAIKMSATGSGVAYYNLALALENSVFLSCSSEASCIDQGDGTIDITNTAGRSRTGEFLLAGVTVHVERAGLIATLRNASFFDLSGNEIKSTIVENAYVTTPGVATPSPSPTPSPRRTTSDTATPTKPATAAPLASITPGGLPRTGEGVMGSGLDPEPIILLGTGVLLTAVALGYLIAKRRAV